MFFSVASFVKAEDLDHVTFEFPSRFDSQDLKITQDTTPFNPLNFLSIR